MNAAHSDPFHTLVQSTLAFYERFGVTPTLSGATSVFREEVGEFIEAAHLAAASPVHTSPQHEHAAEEAADVIVTVIGLCAAAGVTPDMLIAQMVRVAAKNDAKTHATHVYADGKIRRRE